ncbi:MAG: hypothetical protein JNK43_03465, partial [Ignavibacteria bacterium]|nr:hypothetical protein [Ignavibacteria bacterium]
MPDVTLVEFKPGDIDVVCSLLTSDSWPFHSTPVLEKDKIMEHFENGYFNG